jgi:hypothetical protein
MTVGKKTTQELTSFEKDEMEKNTIFYRFLNVGLIFVFK